MPHAGHEEAAVVQQSGLVGKRPTVTNVREKVDGLHAAIPSKNHDTSHSKMRASFSRFGRPGITVPAFHF